jgi:menaquinone-dependent protoporphyrinogen oxidase
MQKTKDRMENARAAVAPFEPGAFARPALVIYATRYGQARKVADHLAQTLRSGGRETDVVDAAHTSSEFDPGRYGAVILVASVHVGKHEGEMIRFVKRHRRSLERVPTGLVSLSLAQASAEASDATEAQRLGAREQVGKTIQAFLAATGFTPTRVHPAAGALEYLKYGRVVRFVMRLIAKSTGAPTDTTKNYEFTDFEALDRFVAEFLSPPTPEGRIPSAGVHLAAEGRP